MIICHKCKQPSPQVKGVWKTTTKRDIKVMYCPTCYNKRSKWMFRRGLDIDTNKPLNMDGIL